MLKHACIYVRIYSVWYTHIYVYCGLGGGGGDRDEGQAGFLNGKGVLVGRGICDCIFKLINLKTFNT